MRSWAVRAHRALLCTIPASSWPQGLPGVAFHAHLINMLPSLLSLQGSSAHANLHPRGGAWFTNEAVSNPVSLVSN